MFLLKWRNRKTRCLQTADAEGSNPSLSTSFGPGDGMAYVLVLETKFWEFESPLGHHFRKIGREVYCRCFESRSVGRSPARGFKSYIFRQHG